MSREELRPLWSFVEGLRQDASFERGRGNAYLANALEFRAGKLDSQLRAHAKYLEDDTEYFRGWIVAQILGVPEKESK